MLTSILRNEVGFAAFACVLGRNEMPALLGYLVAITVLLGTGYTGLEWLVSPDNPSTRQNLSDKQNLPHAGLKKSAANAAGTKEAVPSAKDGSPRTAPSDNADKAGPEEAKVADSGRDGENQKLEKSNENPDAVPSGGCKPIGLTANGEMVFPLQCGASSNTSGVPQPWGRRRPSKRLLHQPELKQMSPESQKDAVAL